MRLTHVCAIAFAGMVTPSAYAFGAEPSPLFVHDQVLKVPPEKCHNAVKDTFLLFHAAPGLQDFDGFQFGVIPAGGSVAAYCLPRPNIPNETWLVIAVASTTSGGAQQLRDSFRDNVLSSALTHSIRDFNPS
jgi:hypothetical protein